jgi:uncharacterized protein (DUF2062 family)
MIVVPLLEIGKNAGSAVFKWRDMLLFAQPSQGLSRNWKQRLQAFMRHVKALQGEPHHVARGMAVGVFVAFTPTIPFHTLLSITLAFVFRGSKPAALIGSWLSNPLTIPGLYYGSYRMGVILLGHQIPMGLQYGQFKDVTTMGWSVACAMIAGGALLGILPAVGGYFITLRLFRRIRARRIDALAGGACATPASVDGLKPTVCAQEGSATGARI